MSNPYAPNPSRGAGFVPPSGGAVQAPVQQGPRPSVFDYAGYGVGLAAPAVVAGAYQAGHVNGAQILAAGANGMAAGVDSLHGGMNPYMPMGAAGGMPGTIGAPGLAGNGATGNTGMMAEAQLADSQASFASLIGIQIRAADIGLQNSTISNLVKRKDEMQSAIAQNMR